MKEIDLVSALRELKSRLEQTKLWFDEQAVVNKATALEYQMQQADFWSNQNEAKRVTALHDGLQKDVKDWQDINNQVITALEMAEADAKDQSVSLKNELEKVYGELASRLTNFEMKKLLASEYDQANALLAIHAGAGGTDAQDWAAMLRRMYLRFGEQMAWSIQIVDESRGQEAGIKSSLLKIEGPYAYGYLKCEAGVHRLVRISPFDAEKMRHTSFALVEVLPELPEVVDLAIEPKDLRIDTFMSSGHGGQSVNTTYSAVRLVHIPTGITVSCQNERSQTQNKETAMKYLRAKLWQIAWGKQQATKKELRGEFKSAEWGNQARSYVLQPYKLVKDHRTEFESNDPEKILDGEIMPFIEARLRQLLKPPN